MKLLTAAINPLQLPANPVAAPTVEDAIRGIHDILQFARGDRAEVIVLCRSLHFLIREKMWAEVTGFTFAEQLGDALESGARVRLLLTNTLKDAHISAQMVGLSDQYDSGRFDLFATGKIPFFDSFPHFTIVKAKDSWLDYVEWRHVEPREKDLEKTDRVDGTLYLGTSEAKSYGVLLKDRFDTLFDKARVAASSKRSAFAAYSLIG
jgi:hypothetical protein